MNVRKSSALNSDLPKMICELREYRKKLQRAIDAFEALQNGDIPPVEFGQDVMRGGTKSAPSYGGMQFLHAVRRLFSEVRGPLTTTQISDGLHKRGFNTGSDKPQKVIAAQLHRYAGKTDSGIVRAGRGLWANETKSPRKA